MVLSYALTLPVSGLSFMSIKICSVLLYFAEESKLLLA